jgi:hypothetical protein
MKLPTDKKERMKWLAIIVVGSLAAVFVAIYFGIIPILQKRSQLKAEIADLQDKLENAKKESKQKDRDVESNRKTLLSIKDISSKYIIKPVLNNYVLMASDFIESQAKKAGFKSVTVSEKGFANIAVRAGDESTKTVKAYMVSVSVQCGYNDFVKLIRQIESANPFYCVTAISIGGQPAKDPRQHVIAFDIQWPTWIDVDMPNKLDAQLSQLAEISRPEPEEKSNVNKKTGKK